MRALILTPWAGDGSSNSYHPLAAEAYPLQRWTDVTAQPSAELQPDPNLYAIEATLTPAALASIDADNRFLVVWSE